MRGTRATIRPPQQAVALPLDVTDADSVDGFVRRATEELGDIEILVAGAGETQFGRLYETSTADRVPDSDSPDRRQPTGHCGPPRHGAQGSGDVIFIGLIGSRDSGRTWGLRAEGRTSSPW